MTRRGFLGFLGVITGVAAGAIHLPLDLFSPIPDSLSMLDYSKLSELTRKYIAPILVDQVFVDDPLLRRLNE